MIFFFKFRSDFCSFLDSTLHKDKILKVGFFFYLFKVILVESLCFWGIEFFLWCGSKFKLISHNWDSNWDILICLFAVMFLVNVFLRFFGNNLLPQQGNVHAIHSRPHLWEYAVVVGYGLLLWLLFFFDEVDIFEDPCWYL